MTADWLWTGVIAGAAGGFTLLFILIGEVREARRDSRWIDIEKRESDRAVFHGDQHPWTGR